MARHARPGSLEDGLPARRVAERDRLRIEIAHVADVGDEHCELGIGQLEGRHWRAGNAGGNDPTQIGVGVLGHARHPSEATGPQLDAGDQVARRTMTARALQAIDPRPVLNISSGVLPWKRGDPLRHRGFGAERQNKREEIPSRRPPLECGAIDVHRSPPTHAALYWGTKTAAFSTHWSCIVVRIALSAIVPPSSGSCRLDLQNFSCRARGPCRRPGRRYVGTMDFTAGWRRHRSLMSLASTES